MSAAIGTDGAFKFCARMIDLAVRDFRTGTELDQQSAASFLRSERCVWMCQAVGATPQDIIKHRLDGADIYNPIFKKKPRKRRCSPATMIEWDGQEKTITEWADHYGIQSYTLRNRIDKYGVREEVFLKTRLSKEFVLNNMVNK